MSIETSKLTALKAELAAGHPVTGAYDADNQVAAGQLNAVNRQVSLEVTTGAEIWNAIDGGEYDALAADDKAMVDHIGRLNGEVPIGAGLVKTKLFAVFAGGSVSRTSLIALASKSVSRSDELGFGRLRAGDCEKARDS